MTVSDILLTSGEIRDVGKLVLQVGGTAETVIVTAEVTPVQIEHERPQSRDHVR